MKRCILTFVLTLSLATSVFAAPGDVLLDENKAVWTIATHQSDVVGGLLTDMAAMPEGYQVLADQQEWAYWLKIDIALSFAGRLFHQRVYNRVLYSIEGYEYGNPRIKAEHAKPVCTAGTGEITCNEDPTEAARPLLLWRQVGTDFVEQDIAGSLVDGTWTFSGIPSGTNKLIVAYDDNLTSFPTLMLTVD